VRLILLLAAGLCWQSATAIELLSEGAMGSVSAVSANSAEEIVNVAGETAAGLAVDDEYESLPFETSAVVVEGDVDTREDELQYDLTQEVEAWANSLRERQGAQNGADVGYVDELPPSSFEDAVVYIRDERFDEVVFAPSDQNEIEGMVFELGRVEQTITVIEQNVDSVERHIERTVDFVANIDAYIGDPGEASIGSSYISDLHGESNVRIAAIKD